MTVISDFRVLFIYPNTMMATLLPINISILNAVLTNAGCVTKLFDTTFYPTEEISFEMKKVELLQLKKFNYSETGIKLKKTDIFKDLNNVIEEFQPNLISFSVVQDTFELTEDLIQSIKHHHIPVIVGGVFATFNPDEVIALEGVDFVCIGEGEQALLELCQKMYLREEIRNIKNLYIKTKSGIIINGIRAPTDLNSLPYLNYDVFEKERLYRPMQGKIYPMIHIELDRGCPYDCTYCGAPRLKRIYREKTNCIYYRQKSVKRIIDEMKFLCDKYNPGYINFNSESFLARSIDDLKEIATLYKKYINLPFWCQSRPETINEEKIELLKEMGCKNLQFGIESGNEHFRKKMLNRQYSNDQILKAFQIVEKNHIEYTVNNIIGFPEETRDMIFDTININRMIHPTTMNVYLFTPYKGTWLYDYCIENGYLNCNSKVHQALDSVELQNQPITYESLKGLQRTFPLYAKFPKSEYDKIKKAEAFDFDGNKIYEEYKIRFYKEVFNLDY